MFLVCCFGLSTTSRTSRAKEAPVSLLLCPTNIEKNRANGDGTGSGISQTWQQIPVSQRSTNPSQMSSTWKNKQRGFVRRDLITSLSAGREVFHTGRIMVLARWQALTLYLGENNNTLSVISVTSRTPVRQAIAPKTRCEPSQTGVSRGHRQPP